MMRYTTAQVCWDVLEVNNDPMHFAYWGKSAVMKPGHSCRYTVAHILVTPDLTSALMCVAYILPLFLVESFLFSPTLSSFFPSLEITPCVNWER